MPRAARIVVPGALHLVRHGGARRRRIFFHDDDYHTYFRLLMGRLGGSSTRLLAWCLLEDHIHLLLRPQEKGGLREVLAPTNRLYARHVNERFGWKDRLWAQRFRSFPVEENQLELMIRFVESHPVRDRMVREAGHYPFSSAGGHLGLRDNAYLEPLPEPMRESWRMRLAEPLAEKETERIAAHIRSGLPYGSDAFITRAEEIAGRSLRPRPPGRPKAG
jgi:putative transposase